MMSFVRALVSSLHLCTIVVLPILLVNKLTPIMVGSIISVFEIGVLISTHGRIQSIVNYSSQRKIVVAGLIGIGALTAA